MRGGVAQPHKAVDRVDPCQERREVVAVGAADAAVGVHVLSDEGDLANSVCDETRHFGNHLVGRARDFAPASRRHNAESAMVVATLLDGHQLAYRPLARQWMRVEKLVVLDVDHFGRGETGAPGSKALEKL